MRYNVKDITIFFHLLKNVNGIGGGFYFEICDFWLIFGKFQNICSPSI